ncbi:MAG: hypothetical protein V4484_16190 [Pseudomonadota bacterium]
MKQIVKALLLISPLMLAGCVSIELPHLVSDTANASVNAYQNLKGKKKGEQDPNVLAYTYVGNNDQTVSEVKQRCETEAARQLRQRSNNAELRYTVLDNEIVAANGTISANCRIAVAK